MANRPGTDISQPYSEPAALTREWRQPLLSVAVGFLFFGAMFGALFLVLSPVVLTSSVPSRLSGGIVFAVGGILLTVQGAAFLLFSAMRVVKFDDGRFVFSSWRRKLTVGPGQLRAIRCIWIDPNRLLPMWVRTTEGSILVLPRIPGAEDLFDALQRVNPAATITSPTPVWGRRRPRASA